jgi:hypothetical protein
MAEENGEMGEQVAIRGKLALNSNIVRITRLHV